MISDNPYVKNCVENWMDDWKRLGWRKNKGTVLANKNRLIELDKMLMKATEAGIVIIWEHGVPEATGNKEAHKLARLGSQTE